MSDKRREENSTFGGWVQELSRRHVFRVLALYVAVGWGFTEIVTTVVEQINAPPLIATLTTIVFIVGFPVVLFLAWMFEVDKQGVRRVPAGRKSQLVVSLALAAIVAGSYGLYRYMPANVQSDLKAPEEYILAVLPFRNLSADKNLEYFGQAFAEDLLNGVAVIPDLRVKATFSSFALAGKSPQAFAEQLGVNRLLDGTYQVQDENLRVSARLVDTDSGDIVWTRVLNDSLVNAFQIQDQLAKDVAAALGLLHPNATQNTTRRVDPLVYQLYLQARQGMINPWMDLENTSDKIRQILEQAPNFPEALSMMGFLDTGRAWLMEDRQAPWLKTGEAYTLKALDINPDLAEAYAVLALNYALQYRWTESRATADHAIEVAGPRPLNVFYTFAYNNLGHRDRSTEILLELFEQDPLNPLITRNLMSTYADQGDHEKALQWEAVIRERGDRYQRHYLIEAYASNGDLETARQLAALWIEEHGHDPELADAYLEARITGESPRWIEATDKLVAEGVLPMGQAIWDYMAAGANEDKIFALVREGIVTGKFNQISLIHPRASRYRQDPRFLEIYTELGLVDYWLNVELPYFCKSETIKGLCE